MDNTNLVTFTNAGGTYTILAEKNGDALLLRNRDYEMVIAHGLHLKEDGTGSWGHGDYCGEYLPYLMEMINSRDSWTRSKQYELEKEIKELIEYYDYEIINKELNEWFETYAVVDFQTIAEEYINATYETKESIEKVFKALTGEELKDFVKHCEYGIETEEGK